MSPAPTRLGHLGAALANRSIRDVELAWGGCITAEMAQAVGLAVVAYRVGGLAGVATLGLVRTVPAAVLGPVVAGAFDRRGRARVLLAVLVVRTALMALAAALLASSLPGGLVFALAALDAIAYSLWWPVQSALLPELAASADEATAANVATTVIENAGTLAGPLVGAALLALSEPAAVFALAGAVLAAAALVLVPVARRPGGRGSPRPPGAAAGTEAGGEPGWTSGLRAGFGDPHPRTVILLYLLLTFGLGMLGVLAVAMAIEVLDIGEPGVGLLNGAVGAGGLVGAGASVVLVGRRRMGTALGLAVATWGVAAAAAGAVPVLPVVVAALTVVGVGTAVTDVAVLTLLQRIVADHVLVRVLGVVEGLWWAMLGGGALAAAALVDLVGVERAVVLAGLVLAVATLGRWRSLLSLDQVAGPSPAVLERLRGVPFFAPLPVPALERMAFAAAAVEVDAGVAVVRRGEAGDRFYVIDAGEVEVAVPGQPVLLSAGQFFGEIALLRDVPRVATVTAVTPVRLLSVRREVFLAALALDHVSHEAALRHADRLAPT